MVKRLLPLGGALSHERGPRRAPASRAHDRLNQDQPLPRVDLVLYLAHDGLRSRLFQPLGRVAPVEHLRVIDGPERVCPLEAVTEVVPDHRALLGVHCEDRVAALCELAVLEHASHAIHVALGLDRELLRVPPQHQHHGERHESKGPCPYEPCRRQQHGRADQHRDVPPRPGGRGLRGDPRHDDGGEPHHHEHQRRSGALGLGTAQLAEAEACNQYDREPGPGPPDRDLDDVDDGLERRLVGPRRTGLPGLIEQGGNPRQVEQPDQPEHDQPVANEVLPDLGSRRVHEHEPCDAAAREHEEAPVVRVRSERAENDGDRDQCTLPQRQNSRDRGRSDQPDQHCERVHPRLLCVVGEERKRREHGRGGPSGRRTEQAAPCPPPGWDREQRAEHRERVHSCLAVAADQVHPEVQQQVVERRRPVLLEHGRDVRERVVRDTYREALVDPELRPECLRAQHVGEADDDAQPEDGRERLVARREARALVPERSHCTSPTSQRWYTRQDFCTATGRAEIAPPGGPQRLVAVVCTTKTVPGDRLSCETWC